MKDGLKEKLQALRIVSLYKRCPQGEQDNAKRLYEKLLKKYGLNDTDITEKERQTYLYWFEFSTSIESRLIHQIIAKELEPVKGEYVSSGCKRKNVGCYLTTEEYESINVSCHVLKRELKKELELCYHAFVQKNNLGLHPDNERKLTPEEEDEIYRVVQYMNAMRTTHIPETRKSRLLK